MFTVEAVFARFPLSCSSSVGGGSFFFPSRAPWQFRAKFFAQGFKVETLLSQALLYLNPLKGHSHKRCSFSLLILTKSQDFKVWTIFTFSDQICQQGPGLFGFKFLPDCCSQAGEQSDLRGRCNHLLGIIESHRQQKVFLMQPSTYCCLLRQQQQQESGAGCPGC